MIGGARKGWPVKTINGKTSVVTVIVIEEGEGHTLWLSVTLWDLFCFRSAPTSPSTPFFSVFFSDFPLPPVLVRLPRLFLNNYPASPAKRGYSLSPREPSALVSRPFLLSSSFFSLCLVHALLPFPRWRPDPPRRSLPYQNHPSRPRLRWSRTPPQPPRPFLFLLHRHST